MNVCSLLSSEVSRVPDSALLLIASSGAMASSTLTAPVMQKGIHGWNPCARISSNARVNSHRTLNCPLSMSTVRKPHFFRAHPASINPPHVSASQRYSLDTKKFPVSCAGKFQLDDVIESQQFDTDILNGIFEVAFEMEKIEKNSPGSNILKGYLMATLFYEPSTRTRLSFESAMKRLGGEVLTTENAREFSSAAKGETLEGMVLL